MIAGCEDAGCPGDSAGGPLYLGMDIGRKRDLTAIWLLERVGDVFWTRALRILEKTPFRDQLDVLSGYLRNPQLRRACIDATGIGAMLAEEAQRVHGQYRVEAVTFTGAVKAELAMPLLAAFQDRTVRIPQSRDIRVHE
jgi:phage FluMu gp28-like protein